MCQIGGLIDLVDLLGGATVSGVDDEVIGEGSTEGKGKQSSVGWGNEGIGVGKQEEWDGGRESRKVC